MVAAAFAFAVGVLTLFNPFHYGSGVQHVLVVLSMAVVGCALMSVMLWVMKEHMCQDKGPTLKADKSSHITCVVHGGEWPECGSISGV